MTHVIATICARGGSKGVPRKNINLLNGKPLICYSIEHAKACDFIDQVVVSTDDPHIAEVARKAGAVVPFLRPQHLADDLAPKRDAILHAVTEIEKSTQKIDVIIDLDVTSPLRELSDIRNCYHLLTPEVDLVMSGYLSNKNPYFNLVELNAQGYIALSKKPEAIFPSRQVAPKVYALNGSIYVWHRHTLERQIWDNERIKIYPMPEGRSVDIDSPVDWKLVELLLSEKNEVSVCKTAY